MTQFVVAVGLALWLGFQYGAYTAWLFMATLFTLILIVIYVLILLSCITYYWRFQRQDANIVLHGLIPVLGIAAFVPAFLAAGGLRVFSFISKLTYPSSTGGAGRRHLAADRDRLSRLPARRSILTAWHKRDGYSLTRSPPKRLARRST